MSLTLDDVIRYLEGLPGEELGKLADEVLARLGMPPVVIPHQHHSHTVGAMGPPVMGGADFGFDVVLEKAGADKLAVITTVRRLFGDHMGLAEAKSLVERAPVVLREQIDRREAEEIADALRRVGAEVKLR